MSLNRKRKTGNSGFVFYNIVYQDGALSSNRKVPAAVLEGAEQDGANRNDAAQAFFEKQDRELAQTTGTSRGAIKTITPSGR